MIQARSKITGKGQLQLPAEIRKIIGGEIGDSVLFTVQDDGRVTIEIIKKRKLSELGGSLKSSVEFTDLEHEVNITKENWVSRRVKEKLLPLGRPKNPQKSANQRLLSALSHERIACGKRSTHVGNSIKLPAKKLAGQ